MNRPVLRAVQTIRAVQPARNGSSKVPEFTIGPHLLTRPKPKMPKGYEKIERKREIFQKDDGIPTYLKGGRWDRILFQLTAIGVLAGNVWSLSKLFEWAQK